MTNERVKYCLSRLINDRKSFIIANIANITDAEHIVIYKEDVEALKAAIEAIDLIEEMTEEATERTAHWDINCDGYYPFCSNCKESPAKMSKYCPNCGSQIVTRGKD